MYYYLERTRKTKIKDHVENNLKSLIAEESSLIKSIFIKKMVYYSFNEGAARFAIDAQSSYKKNLNTELDKLFRNTHFRRKEVPISSLEEIILSKDLYFANMGLLYSSSRACGEPKGYYYRNVKKDVLDGFKFNLVLRIQDSVLEGSNNILEYPVIGIHHDVSVFSIQAILNYISCLERLKKDEPELSERVDSFLNYYNNFLKNSIYNEKEFFETYFQYIDKKIGSIEKTRKKLIKTNKTLTKKCEASKKEVDDITPEDRLLIELNEL